MNAAARTPGARRGRPRLPPTLVSFALLMVVYVGACVRYADQNFGSAQGLFDLLGGYSFLGIAAVGMTFVIISGGIDLSVGAVMGLCSVAAASLMTDHGWPAIAAMGAAVALGGVVGAGNGVVIHYGRMKPFIVTLAAMFLARGLGYMVSLESVGIADETHGALASFAVEVPVGRDEEGEPLAAWLPLTAMIFLAFVGVGAYVARWTGFGRAVHAIGGGEEAAVLMGLPVGRTKVAVYTLSGVCAGAAGVVLTLFQSSGSHTEGVGLELDAIAAVVVGGTLLSGGVGSVVGTLVGVLILGTIVTAITTYEPYDFSSGTTKIAIGGLLLAFVLLQRALTRGRSGIV